MQTATKYRVYAQNGNDGGVWYRERTEATVRPQPADRSTASVFDTYDEAFATAARMNAIEKDIRGLRTWRVIPG